MSGGYPGFTLTCNKCGSNDVFIRNGTPHELACDQCGWDTEQAEAKAKAEAGAKGYYFGHKIIWDGYQWVYADNGNTIESEDRECPRCNRRRTKDGHDPCSANTPNATSVCCGHGVHEPILMLPKDS